jgi:hypothetical protein
MRIFTSSMLGRIPLALGNGRERNDHRNQYEKSLYNNGFAREPISGIINLI